MTNRNCLKGIRCPKCGPSSQFWIEATTKGQVLMSSEGSIRHNVTEISWTQQASITCCVCGHSGKVFEFSTEGPLQRFTEGVFG